MNSSALYRVHVREPYFELFGLRDANIARLAFFPHLVFAFIGMLILLAHFKPTAHSLLLAYTLRVGWFHGACLLMSYHQKNVFVYTNQRTAKTYHNCSSNVVWFETVYVYIFLSNSNSVCYLISETCSLYFHATANRTNEKCTESFRGKRSNIEFLVMLSTILLSPTSITLSSHFYSPNGKWRKRRRRRRHRRKME